MITMRPSDVPTYVEAGAADIGITGKDVLMEQTDAAPRRARPRRLRAARPRLRPLHDGPRQRAGPDPAPEALRRLGVMRVATKYPRVAAAHFEETGRQAEIVEVKGSVELAPLTGLVEAIVDLTATGTTLRENNLVIREEIAVCTARLIANPVAHKLKAAAIDELLARCARAGGLAPAGGLERRRVRLERDRRSAFGALGGAQASPRACARSFPTAPRSARAVAAIIAAVATEGDAAVLRYTRALRRRRRRAAPLRVPPEELDAAIALLPLELVAGLEVAIANVAARRRGRRRRRRPRVALAAGPPRRAARGRRCASAAVYVPGGRAPYPSTVVMGVVTARAAGVIDVVRLRPAGRRRRRSTPSRSARAGCSASSASTAWAARRRSPRSPTGPRASSPST